MKKYFLFICIAALWAFELLAQNIDVVQPNCLDLAFYADGQSGSFFTNLSLSLQHHLVEGHLFFAGLLALLAGFLTSLSPCVYPLIPVTLSIMGTRTYNSRLHGFTIAAAYCAGMVLLYSTLGILFASLGIVVGSLLQNPYILGAIALFFALMALSMLGVFSWAVPSKILGPLSQVGGSGHKGAFLMGLVAGVIAAPCTGPVLAFILTLVALDGQLFTGAYLTFLYALGVGIPFLILGTFSSLLAHLPKSGPFMNVVKGIFAAAMFGASIYFFLLALPKFHEDPSAGTSWTVIDHQESESKLAKALAQAHKECKPVIIDFYASWCAACVKLEKYTFADAEIAAKLKRFSLIKIDATTSSDELNAIQRRYQVVGLPAILFLQPDGRMINNVRISEYVSPVSFSRLLQQLH